MDRRLNIKREKLRVDIEEKLQLQDYLELMDMFKSWGITVHQHADGSRIDMAKLDEKKIDTLTKYTTGRIEYYKSSRMI